MSEPHAGDQPLAICGECGREARLGEPAGPAGTPWTWSIAVDDDQTNILCDACTREHARGIEAKLDRDWW